MKFFCHDILLMVFVVLLQAVQTSGQIDDNHANDGMDDVDVHKSVNNAAIGRWLVESAAWGTLTATSMPQEEEKFGVFGADNGPFAAVLPIAATMDNGRIFFYLAGEFHLSEVALTLSQASLEPDLFSVAGCGTLESAVDAQDPRCIKLTLQGDLFPCPSQVNGEGNNNNNNNDCNDIGRDVLFRKHPVMKKWPEDHHFMVHELILDNIWMIADFGGGSIIDIDYYHSALPIPHIIDGGNPITPTPIPDDDKQVPDWSHLSERARWVVHNSLWTTVSTISLVNTTTTTTTTSLRRHVDNGSSPHHPVAFGNIRSVTDGFNFSTSSGLPIFYIPNVDPTAQDITNGDGSIVLTFSEAALAQRVTDDGQKPCGGEDVGMPTCAQVALFGKAIANTQSNYLDFFANSHPLAPWLAKGGSHMSGKYYTIDLNRVVILDSFGGPREVKLDEYLFFQPGEPYDNVPN